VKPRNDFRPLSHRGLSSNGFSESRDPIQFDQQSHVDLISPQALAWLSTSGREAYVEAFVASLSTVFLVASAIAFFGMLASGA